MLYNHTSNKHLTYYTKFYDLIGFILCMRPANERRRYIVTSSLIGWAHTQNDPCLIIQILYRHVDITCKIMTKSGHNFAHVMTAELPLLFTSGQHTSLQDLVYKLMNPVWNGSVLLFWALRTQGISNSTSSGPSFILQGHALTAATRIKTNASLTSRLIMWTAATWVGHGISVFI